MAIAKELHISAALTKYALAYKAVGFVADIICPRVLVGKESDKYYIYGTEDMKKTDTLRARKTASKGISRSLSSESYFCNPHGLHELVDEIDRKNADPAINPDLDAVDGIMQRMMISLESEISTLFTTAANYASGFKTTLSGSNRWDDAGGTSDPLGNIDTAKIAVKNGCGIAPNTILIPYEVGLALGRHPEVKELTKYTGRDVLLSSGLPPTLRGLRVIEAGTVYDTIREGQTGPTFSGIWSDYVVIFYLEPTVSIKSMAFAKNFSLGAWYVKNIPQPDLGDNTEKIEINDPGRDPLIICQKAGYLYSDVLV